MIAMLRICKALAPFGGPYIGREAGWAQGGGQNPPNSASAGGCDGHGPRSPPPAVSSQARHSDPRLRVESAIRLRLRGQHLAEILPVRLTGSGRTLTLEYRVDTAALDALERTWLGRVVLMTNQHHWSSAEIIRAYRGQATAEGVFRALKDPFRLALRPQYHWTDQKLHVHAFICVIAYLLATLVHRTARREAGFRGSADALFDALTNIRRVSVMRLSAKGRPRMSEQLEHIAPEHLPLLDALAISR